MLGNGRVTLQAPIATALASHRLAAPGAVDPAVVVATFARPGGEIGVLVRSQDLSLPTPTLEELVMGYLSAARGVGRSGSNTDPAA